MLSEKAKSRAQQRFFGMVRAAQKGKMDNPSSEVLDAADSMKVSDVKKFAKTKHKGLPEKKKIEEVAFLAAAGKVALAAGKGAVKQKAKQVVKQKAANVAVGAIPQPNRDQQEGNLHKWFSGSKSKDGKKGWVNVVTGGTCASDKPGEGTPKCVSSSKRASMTKAERASASRRKKAADPGQQSKSGAAKPTYVATDKKKKVNESKGTAELAAIKLRGKKACAVCGSFTHVTGDCPKKDHPVNETTKYKGVLADPMKEAYRVLASSDGQEKPSQFSYKDEKTAKKYVDSIKKGGGKATITKESVLTAIGRKKKKEEKKAPKAMDAGARAKRLLQRRVHAKYVSGSTENVPDDIRDHYDVTEKCWDGYTQKGMKKKGKKVVPNCVPVGEAKVDEKLPEYKRATARDKRYGNPHGSHELGGGIRKDRRADHEAKRGVKEEVKMTKKAYNKLHKDFKSDDPKNPRTTKYNPKTGGTESHPVKFVDEAKVEAGRSDYGKASVRNKRKFGREGEPAVFDASGDRGKMIDQRRSDHKAKRGVKEGKGYQPEIEVIKSKDLRRKERDSKLPPHLQGDALGKMKKAFASTNEEVVGEGAMKAIKNFVNPDPSLSNEPSVRAGVRTPKTGFKHVPSFNKDGTSSSYGKKGTTAVVDTAKPVVKKATQVAGNVTKGVTSAVAKGIKQGATAVGKAVLPVAGGVGAGLAVSKGVDNLMKAGKKKKVDEELSIVDKMLIEFAPTFLVIEKKKQPSVHDDYYDPMEDPTFDPHEAEATRGQSGKGTKGKMNVRKKYPVKEGVVDVIEKKKPSVHDDYYDPMEDPTFDPHEAEATRGQSGRGTKGKMNTRKKYKVKESAVLDANTKIKNEKSRKKDEAKLAKLTHIYKGMKTGQYNSYEPEGEELKEYSPNVSYQAKGGKKSGKLGKSSIYSLKGKDESKKDFRKSHVKDVEDGYVGKGHKPTTGSLRKEDYYRGTGEKVVARTKKFMDKKGQKGAPGLDAMKARTAEHKAKRGVKEEVVTEADKKGKGSGKKDACYNKVKASAKVWPSAYASGRLVQCRKKGASNYGNKSEGFSSWRDELDEGAAWTKKSGKSASGGLNEKGRKSYERENPGSDLKAPSKKKGNKRRASFCARMKGMKKKLTSAKTASDPDSRINKSLRAWNC